MGLFDNLKEKFSGSKNMQPIQREDPYEKARLCEQIVDLVNKIKRINSFDSSIWNLANASVEGLKRRSLEELTNIKFNLESRLSELQAQSQRPNSSMQAAEASKWTGRPTQDMSNRDLGRFQEGDDGRY